MSADVRQTVGSIFSVVGYVVGAATSWTGVGLYVGGALIAVGTALSYTGARQMAKQAQEEANRLARGAARSSNIKVNYRGGAEVHRMVLGEVRIGGLIAALGPHASLPNQANVGIVHSICHTGGCEGITDIWIDDHRIAANELSGDPNTARVNVTRAAYVFGLPSIYLRHFRGTGTQNAYDEFVTAGVDTSTSWRRGMAWTGFELVRPDDSYDEAFRDAFPRGTPTLGVTQRGVRVYDPRLDTTNGGSGAHRYADTSTWSWWSGNEQIGRNPALLWATWALTPKIHGGGGRDPSDIIWSTVAAAANICEEPQVAQSGTYVRVVDGFNTVTVTMTGHGYKVGDRVRLDFTSGAGTDGHYVVRTAADANTFTVRDTASGDTSGNVNVIEPRYACDIAIDTNELDEVNMRRIADTMMGEIIPVDGKYKVYAGAYRSPTFTLDESWLRGEVSVRTLVPNEKVYNAVRVLHDDRLQNYRQVEAAGFTDATYEADDGGQFWKEEVLEGVSSAYQAQRHAKIYGLRSRAQRVLEIPCNLKALDVECWENGYINIAELGLTNSIHRIVDWTWDGVGPVLIVQQDDSAYYAGAAYVVPITTEAPAVTKETPATPAGVTAFLGIDGIDIAWTTPHPSTVKQVDVYRSTDNVSFTLIKSAVGYNYHDPITVSGTYYYKLKSRTNTGVQSVFSSTVSATVPSPSSIVNLKLANQAGAAFSGRDAQFEWDNGTPPSHVRFRQYRVRIIDPADSSVMRTEYTTAPFFEYTYEMNLQDSIAEGYSSPRRAFTIEVRQEIIDGTAGAASQLAVSNTAPSAPTVTLAPSFDGLEVFFDKPVDPDFLGAKVYVSTSSGFTPGSGNIQYDGPHQRPIFISGLTQSTTYYVKVIPYDVFGDGGTSTEVSAGTTATPVGDVTPPTVPNGASAPTVTSIVRTNKLFAEGELKVAWTASTDASGRILYRVEFWTNDSTKTQVVETENLTVGIYPAEIGVQYSVRVQALDYAGNISAFTATATHTIVADATAPANVTGATATGGLDKTVLDWTNPTDADFIETQIYRGITSDFTPDDGTNLIGRVRADAFVDANVLTGASYYYKFKTRDVSGNVSTASGAVGPATPFTITSANIGSYMADLAVLRDKLANSAVDSTKIADGAVLTAKLADLNVTLDKLAANSVDTSKLIDSAVTALKIGAAAVEESKIAVAAVTATKIADLAVTAPKISATIGGGNLLSNSGFANHTGNQPHGYDVYNNAGISFTWTRPAGRRSGFAVGVRANQTGATNFGIVSANNIGAGNVLGGVLGGWQPNKTYVLSYYAKKIGGASWGSGTLQWNNAPTVTAISLPTLTTEYQRYVFRLAWGATVEAEGRFYIDAVVGAPTAVNDEFIVSDIQVEEGDVLTAYAPRPDEILPSTITAVEIADNAITAPKIIAGAIVAGKIAAGAISTSDLFVSGVINANAIGAQAITTAKLLIGTPSQALNDDPGCVDQSAWGGWSFESPATVTAITDGKTGNSVLRATGSTRSINKRLIPCDVNRQYRISAWVNGRGGNGVLYLRTVQYIGTEAVSGGVEVTHGVEGVTPPANTWTYYSGVFTPNSGKVNFVPQILLGWGGTTGYMDAQDIRIDEVLPSTLIQDGAITTDKINALAVTSAKIQAGAIIAGKIAAGAINATDIIADSMIVAGKLAANSISASSLFVSGVIVADALATDSVTANKILAGAITASKVVITGRGSAINDDPNTQDGSAWQVGSIVDDTTSPSGKAWEISTVGATSLSAKRYPIDRTKNYNVRIWGKQVSGTPASYILVAFYDASGNLLDATSYPANWPNGGSFHYWGRVGEVLPASYTEYEVSFGANETRGIPTGATHVALGVLANYSGSGTARYTSFFLVEKSSSNLIVDGVITAAKLAANAVTAVKIEAGAVTTDKMTANTINGDRIAANTLDAGKIVAGSITTDRMTANSINGDRISAGTIVADKINANGLTIKDANGNILLNAGVELGINSAKQGNANNALDPSTWVVGTSETQSGFGALGTSSGGSNVIALNDAPDGLQRPVWTATSGSSAGASGEGGWNGANFPVIDTKMYRFAIWIRARSTLDGTAYFGVGGSQVNDIGGGVNTNPYFIAQARSGLTASRWYLFVGFVFPSGYAGGQLNQGGVYDGVTGVKVANATDFLWTSGQTNGQHRVYQYYTSGSGRLQDFWMPRVDLCDGSEPSLADLLSVASIGARNQLTSTNIGTYVAGGAIGDTYIASLNASKINAGTISADRIGANSIGAGKLSVSQLSAIAADLGTITAGTVTGATIQTATSGARSELTTANGLRVYNASAIVARIGNLTDGASIDGSGFLGRSASGGTAISWDANGDVTLGQASSAKFFSYTDIKESGTSQTIPIPKGARLLTIRAWGGGGGGARNSGGATDGAGGGAGAVKKIVMIRASDWNGNLTYTVGVKGTGRTSTNGNGTAGTASTITSSGLSFTNLNISAGGGGAGTTSGGGAGGTASGGDTNVSGSSGVAGTGAAAGEPGGNSGAIDSIQGIGGVSGTAASLPGGGGIGQENANGQDGADGLIQFIWS